MPTWPSWPFSLQALRRRPLATPLLTESDWREISALLRQRRSGSRQKGRAQAAADLLNAQRGPGQDQVETRPYQFGDDTRRLNWRQLARSGQAHVRQQQQERSANWHGLLDLRGALLFGTRGRTRAAQAARALLLDAAWQLRVTPQSALRCTLWLQHGPLHLNCGRGAAGLRRLAQQLQQQHLPQPQAVDREQLTADATGLCLWLEQMQRSAAADRLLLSSALLDAAPLPHRLQQALWRASREAELLVLLPRDPAESAWPELPAARCVELHGAASGELDPKAMATFKERAQLTAAATARHLRACGARLLQPDSRAALPVLLRLLRPEFEA